MNSKQHRIPETWLNLTVLIKNISIKLIWTYINFFSEQTVGYEA